jgi:hypothetical protein
MDNIEHSDPEDPIAQQIKAITDKKTDMTSEDRRRKDWLAYNASLYIRDGGIVLPWRCINRALRTGGYYIGGASASGKADAGVACGVLEIPLDYSGTQDPAKLHEDEKFRFRTMVNKNPTGKKAMVPSVRPIFPSWGLTFELTVFNEIISWDVFTRVFQAAGTAAGLGNARKLGYGRFTTEIEKM